MEFVGLVAVGMVSVLLVVLAMTPLIVEAGRDDWRAQVPPQSSAPEPIAMTPSDQPRAA
jgi:hypothetical protein